MSDLLSSDRQRRNFSADQRTAALEAVNSFVKLTARERRRWVCALGESCVPAALSVYDDSKGHHGGKARKAALEFLSAQTEAHHPGGAKDENEGAFWKDKIEWERCLRRIYTNLVETPARSIASGKMTTNRTSLNASGSASSSSFLLSNDHVELAADVCLQLIQSQASGEAAEGEGPEQQHSMVTQYVRTESQVTPYHGKQEQVLVLHASYQKQINTFYHSILAKTVK